MTRTPAWSTEENTALVALYFAMLDKALGGSLLMWPGQPYNKAELIRMARGVQAEPGKIASSPNDALLRARSKQSIEFKLMNATAAHRDIDPTAVTMHGYGYRAMSNYQAALRDAMREEIDQREGADCNIGLFGGGAA